MSLKIYQRRRRICCHIKFSAWFSNHKCSNFLFESSSYYLRSNLYVFDAYSYFCHNVKFAHSSIFALAINSITFLFYAAHRACMNSFTYGWNFKSLFSVIESKHIDGHLDFIYIGIFSVDWRFSDNRSILNAHRKRLRPDRHIYCLILQHCYNIFLTVPSVD